MSEYTPSERMGFSLSPFQLFKIAILLFFSIAIAFIEKSFPNVCCKITAKSCYEFNTMDGYN